MGAVTLGSMTSVGDITYAALDWYIRSPAFMQAIQDRPLLRILRGAQKSFSSGAGHIIFNVQGDLMIDGGTSNSVTLTANPIQGYTADEALSFGETGLMVQSTWHWYEVHYGLAITATDLKKDGVVLNDSRRLSANSQVNLTRITSILENRLTDFAESYAKGMNSMFWADGSADSQHVPGLQSILTDTPAVGTTGGINRASYSWWRHRTKVGADKITASPTNQTLTKTLRAELRQLRRYGGRPNQWLAGSDFIAGLESELHEKGEYTTVGFANEGRNDLGMAKISMKGLGSCEYDPTMDTIGWSKRAVIFDDRKIVLMPMEGEDDKVLKPERPYNYLVYLQSMTWTGGLVCKQLNANGVYEIA